MKMKLIFGAIMASLMITACNSKMDEAVMPSDEMMDSSMDSMNKDPMKNESMEAPMTNESMENTQ